MYLKHCERAQCDTMTECNNSHSSAHSRPKWLPVIYSGGFSRLIRARLLAWLLIHYRYLLLFGHKSHQCSAVQVGSRENSCPSTDPIPPPPPPRHRFTRPFFPSVFQSTASRLLLLYQVYFSQINCVCCTSVLQVLRWCYWFWGQISYNALMWKWEFDLFFLEKT